MTFASRPVFSVRRQRLDDVVHVVEVRGPVGAGDAQAVASALDAALADGARWIMLDLAAAPAVADSLLAALSVVTRILRNRRGELIVAGAAAPVVARMDFFEVPDRPALAATVEQALMILKMLRPKTRVKAGGGRFGRRPSSPALPRVEPSAR